MANLIETALRKTVTQGVMKLADFNRRRMPELDSPNPFLTGLNAPMNQELTLTELAVTGSLPAALDGRYLRIGPNPIVPPKGASHHWFVGDGMVHGVRLQRVGRCGTATAGSAPTRSAGRWASRLRPVRASAATPSTPMCWAMPARPWPWSRPAATRLNWATSCRPSRTTRSRAA